MKLFKVVKYKFQTILAAAFFWSQAAHATGPVATITPSSVSNDYSGSITIQVSGLTNGETVVVQKYLDLNTNGAVDSADLLVQQFNLTDGKAAMVIGGVTNINVPYDTDGTNNGQITARFALRNGDFTQSIIGQYLYVVSSPVGNFSALTNSLTVAAAANSQQIAGSVTNGGVPVPNAVVIIFPPPRAGHQGLGEPLAAGVANNSGNFSIPIAVGTYRAVAFSSNYIADTSASSTLVVSNGVTVSNNLSLTVASSNISGTFVNATNSSFVLPGVFSPATANGFLGAGFSDSNGVVTIGVGAGSWSVGGDSAGFTVHGYVGSGNGTNVTAGQTGLTFPVKRATALFYGTVTDSAGSPLAEINIDDSDENNLYAQQTASDGTGSYVVGAVGGLTSADPWMVNASSSGAVNYIFSQTGFDQNGGTNVNVGDAIQANITALVATNQISGRLIDQSGAGLSGIGINASATISNVFYSVSTVDTDTNGNYTLNVGAGPWTVSANCGCSNSDCLGTNYLCANSQTVTVSNSNVSVDLVAVSTPYTISGVITNSGGQGIANVNVDLSFTLNGTNNFNESAITDGSGAYSLPVGNGTWNLSLMCSGSNSLNNAGYGCTSNQSVVISGASKLVNIPVQTPPQLQVFSGGAPVINGQAGAIGFGSVLQNQGGLSLAFTLTNSGQQTLTISSISVPGAYSVVSNVTSIAGNSKATLVIQLTTGAAGVQAGNVIISDNDSTTNSFSFPITGTVTASFTLSVSASPTNGGVVTGGGIFAAGTTNTVTATANGGFTFVDWTQNGVEVSTSTNYQVVLSGDVTLVANFVSVLSETVSASPTNGGSVSGGGSFNFGTTNTVHATANSGFIFRNWTQNGVIVTTLPDYIATITSNIVLVANFAPVYNVTVAASPTNGGTVTGNASYIGVATNNASATPNSGYIFTNWTQNGVVVSTNVNYTFIVASNIDIVANFLPVFTVTTSASPTNGGSITGAGTFLAGSTNTVVAVPTNGFIFTNWSQDGNVVATTTNYSVILNSNITLVANFLPVFTLGLSASPTNGGTVSGGGTFLANTTNTVFATPNAGFIFTNWMQNGVIVAATTNYDVVLSSNSTLIANFLPEFTVTTSASPTNGGTISGGGTFLGGSTNTLTATATNGFLFSNWKVGGSVVSTSTNYSFVLSSNVTVVATFLPSFTLTVAASPTNAGTVVGGGQFASGTTNLVTAFAGNGFIFTNFTLGGVVVGTSTNFSVVLTSNVTVTANFAPVFTLAVSASPTNAGTVSGGGTFAAGSTNTVTAHTTSTNYYFTNWTVAGVVVSTSTNYTFGLTSNVTAVANFALIPSALLEVAQGTNVMVSGQTNPFDFGIVLQNQTAPIVTFALTNGGGQPLTIGTPLVPHGFILVSNPPPLLTAGSNGTFSVQLDTTAIGSNSGNIVITNGGTNASPFFLPVAGFVGTKNIVLSGSLAFGGVPLGSSSNLTLTISNAGNTALFISNISYPPAFSGSFSNSVGPGSSRDVVVTFVPGGATFYGGTVTVGADATGGIASTIASGFGGSGGPVLTLIPNGNGTITPNLNGETLVIGKKYTIKAVPAAGNLFSNWSGSVTTNKNPLTFTMEDSTVIQANFVTNPFLATAGKYNGIFSTTNGVTEQTAGMLKNLAITTKGTYTGSLLLAGVTHPLIGAFDLGGNATNTIKRSVPAGGNVVLTMTVANSTNPAPQVTGTVAGANNGAAWIANLTADLATNTVASAEFTMLMLPDTNNTPPGGSPGGAGYGLITNNQSVKSPVAAAVHLTGALADGTAFSQAVPVSADGYVPVYANLYANQGLLLGWINLNLSNSAGNNLTWIHPARTTGIYKAGFTNKLATNQILISPWTNPPAGLSAISNLSLLGSIYETNGATNIQISIGSNNKITGSGVTGTLNPKTGLVTLTIGAKAPKTTATGVILPDGPIGGGYFLTKTNAQAIKLTP